MQLKRVLPFAKVLLKSVVLPGDIVVDATVGNGHDTVFLAEQVGESGKVYGFDIQSAAINKTAERLQRAHLEERVTLFKQSHDTVLSTIPSDLRGKIRAAIFNLGYLPGGDKTIVTTPSTTISAIEQLLQLLTKNGLIILVVYQGHSEGKKERDALLEYVKKIDQKIAHVLQYRFINQKNNPPFLIAIEKL